MAPHVNKINNLHHQDNSNNLNQVNSQIEDLNSYQKSLLVYQMKNKSQFLTQKIVSFRNQDYNNFEIEQLERFGTQKK
jgi:hypothetical protein